MVTRIVRASGFRAPKGAEYSIDEIDIALQFLEKLGGGACVIKPKAGSGGRGITTSISTESRLVNATLHASNTLTIPSLLIEEQMPGDSYRLLYLGGKLIHAVQRGKCTVVGNGRNTIARLVEYESQARLRDTPLRSIEPLSVDFEMKVTLSDQGLSLRSIPSDGSIVRVKNVSNQNERRDQRDVTRLVHADYHLLAEKMLHELGIQLIGIDVMSVDVSLPPNASGAAVLEINIPPGLHYHELIRGAESFTPVGATILEYVLADRRASPYTEAALRISERTS
jgi:cyanophycin synthetase